MIFNITTVALSLALLMGNSNTGTGLFVFVSMEERESSKRCFMGEENFFKEESACYEKARFTQSGNGNWAVCRKHSNAPAHLVVHLYSLEDSSTLGDRNASN